LSNAKTADQGKLLLREVQSLGYLSRALMADIGVTSSQMAMGDREAPVQGTQASPIGASSAAAPSAAAPRPETAAALLKKMPPAPQTRGMPSTMSPRFAPPPPASAAPPSANMYQMLFPDDPISKMMGQRQQPVAPPQ
jgi:hypothetical protein